MYAFVHLRVCVCLSDLSKYMKFVLTFSMNLNIWYVPFKINPHWQNFFDTATKIYHDLNMILPFYLVIASFRA